jgi:hypothetical protein
MKAHARKCECRMCLRRKIAEYEARIALMGGMRPPDLEHTVPVRPHWRKVRGHLAKSPALRALVLLRLAEIVKRRIVVELDEHKHRRRA